MKRVDVDDDFGGDLRFFFLPFVPMLRFLPILLSLKTAAVADDVAVERRLRSVEE